MFYISHVLSLCPQASQTSPCPLVWLVVLIPARLVMLTLGGWVLCWTLVNLFKDNSVLNLLFLGYPYVCTRLPQTHLRKAYESLIAS